jgi:hypothetical protein
MNNKKNIDRLFQERFKDFEAVPNEVIWNNIHDALHKKKKRRIIPLWWKRSGIAAGFAIAFFVFNQFSTNLISEPAVVVAPKEVENTIQQKSNAIQTSVAVDDKAGIDATNTNNTEPTESDENSIIPQKKKSVTYPFRQKNKVVKINTSTKNTQHNDHNLLEKKNISSNEAVRTALFEKSNLSEKSIENNLLKTDKNSVNIAAVGAPTENNFSNKSFNNSENLKEKDSTSIAIVSGVNPLEEILKKKNQKEDVVADVKINRWNVTTNVAPVFFNSASNGSPIESQFAGNSKSYENNLSVGVGVRYAVNKKLNFRTGINSVQLGYGTNDVMFFGTLNEPGVGNLSSSGPTSTIEVISAHNSVALRPFQENLQSMERGVLNQRMGYYEVPLELSYAVVDKKFGIQVIGGMSTLFLNENSVSVQSATTTMSLGQANNLNNVHFSSNIGLGFKYEFWKNFEAHFEPTFKYQFNTFSRDAGNFRPYFVGLYSGVSFRF